MTAEWSVTVVRERPSAVHERGVPDPAIRNVRVVEATVPALVLGSTQPATDVVAPRADVEIVRRRSGGGAVLVAPGDVLWVDVVLPRDDPLWHDDVSRSFEWLGDVWARTIGSAARVHRGPLVRTPLSAKVCFAGLGPGEVTIRDRKVVGIAQRRTRAGALFQCACVLSWDPEPLATMLGIDPLDVAGLAAPAEASPAELLDTFREELAGA